MRLGPAIRLLQAPLRAFVVPKAHISAKPAKTPTSASVSTGSGRAGPGRAGSRGALRMRGWAPGSQAGKGRGDILPGLVLLEGTRARGCPGGALSQCSQGPGSQLSLGPILRLPLPLPRQVLRLSWEVLWDLRRHAGKGRVG